MNDNTTAPAAAKPPSIVLSGVSKNYGGNTALSNVSMRVAQGEFVVLLGPSGAGKSTIFRCITALTAPDKGNVEVLGERIDQLSKRDLRVARRGIGLIFQQLNLLIRPLNSLYPFGLSLSKPRASNALRQAQGERSGGNYGPG